mmetsp:Transcript_21956/g.36328  ORF Transcript_21956/g.36328 Transcript_21956/m.36328 type:complete len:389 (+) Transcript_21956:253-1419(+)
MNLNLSMYTLTTAVTILLLSLGPDQIHSFSFSFSSHASPNAYVPSRMLSRATTTTAASTSTSTSTRLYAGAEADSATKKLLEKAAQLRAEIAALEGKSVEEVEKEAKDKKDAKIEADRKSKEILASTTTIPFDKGRMLNIPESTEEMVTQAARAIEAAYRDGITRQTVQLALVAEGDSMMELNQWPGGAQQMYREAGKPLSRALLKEIKTSNATANAVLPPNVVDKDIWDFDGSALMTAEAQQGPEDDVQALIFANTDVKYVRDIAKIDKAMGDKLFLLVNPFWRNLESWGVNVMAPGAKTLAKKTIFDQGYDETYVFLRFSVRGELCAAVKAYPYDWQLFAYLEDGSGWERPIRLGSSEEDPTSAVITELLNERDEFKQTKIMRQFK